MSFNFSEAANLRGKKALIVGASRGIGESMARELARHGVDVALAASNRNPQWGTTHTVAADLCATGVKAVGLDCNLLVQERIPEMVQEAHAALSGIDFVLYVASDLLPATLAKMELKAMDRVIKINSVGAFLTFQAALDYLLASAAAGRNPHILTISPAYPIAVDQYTDHSMTSPNGFYAMAKLGMTQAMLTFANALRKKGVAGNALWPEIIVDTAATRRLASLMPPQAQLIERSRQPQIMADAAAWMLAQPSSYTLNMLTDAEVLRGAGVSDLDHYSTVPGTTFASLVRDWFV